MFSVTTTVMNTAKDTTAEATATKAVAETTVVINEKSGSEKIASFFSFCIFGDFHEILGRFS